MILQTFMPIIMPMDSGPSHPMTEEEQKVLLGVWIVLNALWLTNWIVLSIVYLHYHNKNKKLNKNEYWALSTYERNLFGVACDFFMIVIWLLFLLFCAGEFVSRWL